MKIPRGFCQCGCGKVAPIAEKTCSREGLIKGQPKQFIKNHQHGLLTNRFWEKVDKTGPTHPTLKSRCWLYIGSNSGRGYGKLNAYGKSKNATHVAWFLTTGKWPTKWMLHKCDNPPCVNPAHLFQGTHQDNVADRTIKGRQPEGEQHSGAKLTTKQVLQIRKALKKGHTMRSLAERFGVCKSTIGKIALQQGWKTV